MSEKWVCLVCDSSVNKDQKICSVCSCPSDVSGEDFKCRKRHWDAYVRDSRGSNASHGSKSYKYIPESGKEKLERKIWGDNRFGSCWAIVLIYGPVMLVHLLFVHLEKVAIGLPLMIFVLFILKPYFEELLKYRQFIFISLVIFIANTALAYTFQIAPEAKNMAAGLMIFFIMPAVVFSALYSIKSKHSKAINAAYNNSHHSPH